MDRFIRFFSSLWLSCVLVVFAPCTCNAASQVLERSTLASQAGATLESNLLKGGGTDDTAALQAVLNRASNGRPVRLVLDGVALVGGLNVYGNTTIECIAGGGLYRKDGSSRAIIRNVHRSGDAITDEHIALRGCFLNGNRDHQPGATPVRAAEATPTISTLEPLPLIAVDLPWNLVRITPKTMGYMFQDLFAI